MDKVLDFLANNYIYFLIAAGVLVLALIGFIFDSKKKNKEENNISNAPLPSINNEPTIPSIPGDVVAGPGSNMETPVVLDQQNAVEEPIIPGPPAPEVESINISNVEQPDVSVVSSNPGIINNSIEESSNSMEPVINPEATISMNAPSVGEQIVAEPVEEIPTLDLSGVTEPQPVENETEDTPIINVEELK